mmetsp:Transcript_17902/g.30446  ORF Transcript_17902/g.30446 Transcript_17902/m.30446 type:complete len:229 (+) Transcript_17902:183-869(+)
MSDSQYGFVSGPVFTLVTQLSMFVMGYFVDKYNRRALLLVFCVLWNSVCLLNYFVEEYWQLLTIRIMFAMLGSVSPPACISLINDYFKNEQKARASSVYVMAVSFGVCCANLTTLINNQYGWRNATLIVSVIGVAVGFLASFLEEPRNVSHKKDRLSAYQNPMESEVDEVRQTRIQSQPSQSFEFQIKQHMSVPQQQIWADKVKKYAQVELKNREHFKQEAANLSERT